MTPRGIQNPAWCPWQLHLARAVSGDDPDRARALAADAVRRARAFGAPSGIGQALHVAAEVAAPEDRAGLLREAVALLSESPAGYELARALAALGTELRDTELLAQAVVTARECGADGLVKETTSTLLGLGGGVPCGSSWEDEPTEEELRAAERAVRADRAPGAGAGAGAGADADAGGDADEAPAWPGAVRDLSAACRKPGTDRSGLPAALEGFARSAR